MSQIRYDKKISCIMTIGHNIGEVKTTDDSRFFTCIIESDADKTVIHGKSVQLGSVHRKYDFSAKRVATVYCHKKFT